MIPTIKEISGMQVCVVLPIRGTISQAITGALIRMYYNERPDSYTIGSRDNCLKFEETDVACIEKYPPEGFAGVEWIVRLKGA